MMRLFCFCLVCMILFNGCAVVASVVGGATVFYVALVGLQVRSLPNTNLFLIHDASDMANFKSTCKDVKQREIINDKIYRFKDCDSFYCFSQKSKFGFYDKNKKIVTISTENFIPFIPLESCDKTWCKIYYPCGEQEYFVKKDEIEPYVKKAK